MRNLDETQCEFQLNPDQLSSVECCQCARLMCFMGFFERRHGTVLSSIWVARTKLATLPWTAHRLTNPKPTRVPTGGGCSTVAPGSLPQSLRDPGSRNKHSVVLHGSASKNSCGFYGEII